MDESTEKVVRLKVLYDTIPETEGCDKCSEVYGKSREHWCCTEQHPELGITEFACIGEHFRQWSQERRNAGKHILQQRSPRAQRGDKEQDRSRVRRSGTFPFRGAACS